MLSLARDGRLYPSLIIYGGSFDDRKEAAIRLGRTLLCQSEIGERPCGQCRNCSRIHWDTDLGFHPDFRLLTRDLTATTSVEAARGYLKLAQQSPFEARGQVFVVAEADTLSPSAANAFLKILEEPPISAPRNFLLLCPSRQDLLPTLRSRSWLLYLGQSESLSEQEIEALSHELKGILALGCGGLQSMAFAQTLLRAGQPHFKDLRDKHGFSLAAGAVLETALDTSPPLRVRLLDLAHALLEAPSLRLRSIPAERILEGIVARYLGSSVSTPRPRIR